MNKPAKKEAIVEAKKIPAPPIVASKKEDQKSARESKTEDQKSARPKKLSETTIKYRAQPKFDVNKKITLKVTKNPKSRGAAQRFSFYKNGMTVGEYQEVMKANGSSPKLAMDDMRWDYVSGFIDIQ